jgi:ABC-type transport system involved in cytochrome bd biosynthesis fused ATPase/permease subunit
VIFGILTFLGIIAVLIIVIAGIRLIIGGADEGQREKARDSILYAVIGLIVILLAGAIVQWVEDTFVS